MDNNNGKGIFYGVIGVATLVVAIIGATFAYFSATVTPTDGSDDISGATNNDIAGNMSLTVTRILPANSTGANGATATKGLVPANIDGTIGQINNAVAAGCVDANNGFTGCHVYKITASSSTAVGTANINLKNFSVTATDTDDWKFAVYRGSSATAASDNAASAFAGGMTAAEQINEFTTNHTTGLLDIHSGAAMTATDTYYYYLIVYLENDTEHSQNDGTQAAGNTNAVGTYSGQVELQAAGGRVSASFASTNNGG